MRKCLFVSLPIFYTTRCSLTQSGDTAVLKSITSREGGSVSVYVACERVRVLCYFPLSDREIRINGGTACFFPFFFIEFFVCCLS